MKPTEWMNRTMRISRFWIAGALCCLPLMASPEEDAETKLKAKLRAEAIERGKAMTKDTTAKLKERIIPHVSFKDASIEDVAVSLSKTLEDILPPMKMGDTGEIRPAIWVRTSYGYKPTPVTLEMENESAEKVLNEVARQAGMYVRVSLTMVTIWPTKENWEKARAEMGQAAAASEGNDEGAAGGAEGEMSAKEISDQMLKNGEVKTKATTTKLKEKIIPSVSFKDASIDDVAASLSKTLEDILPIRKVGDTDQTRPGIWVSKSYGYEPTPVTVDLKDATAEKVLATVAERAGMVHKVVMNMVVLFPKPAEKTEDEKAASSEAAMSSPPLKANPEQAKADASKAKERAEAIERGKKASAETKEMLKTTILPHVSFKEASIDDVAASLGKTINELKPKPEDGTPEISRFFAIHVRKGHDKPTPVTLEMKDASAVTVLDEVAKQAGMLIRLDTRSVTYWPKPAEEKPADVAVGEGANGSGGASEGAAGGAGGGSTNVSGSFLVAMKGVVDPFFTWIWAATLRASVIGGVILALQLLLGRIIPARWRYALWAPMVLVLVLPVLPEVPFGLFPAKAPASVVSEVVATPEVTTNVAAAPAAAAPVTEVATQGGKAVSLNPYALIWLGGVLGVLAFGISSYRRNLRGIVGKQVAADAELMRSIEQAASEVKLRKLPRVIVSTAVETPAVAGLLRPSLLLPTDFKTAFTAEEARLVLVHELTHLKRHDLLVNWLCCVLQALHWFNPVLWFAFARMRDDRESACDDQVLSLDGKDHRSTYGHALLKLQSSPVSPALHLGFVGIFERNAGLKSRIREIGRHRKAHPAYHAVGFSLLAALLVFGTTKAQEAKPKPKPQARPSETAKAKPVSPEKAAIEKKLDTIVLPVVKMEDSPVEEAIDYLRIMSMGRDTAETNAAKKGVNFVIRKPRNAGGDAADPGKLKVTLDLKDVSMRKALEGICAETGLQYQVDEFAVTLLPAGEAPEPTDPAAPPAAKPSGKAIEAAKKVIIPVMDLQNTSLEEAVDFLKLRSTQLSEDKKEVPIRLKASAKKDAVIQQLQLAKVPLSEAVRYVAEAVKQP
ncbi:MAG TPA: M56 family metallopeptidase, partial [Haloferula sp.]